MSNVTLDIAGRNYTIACAPGEEQHIEMLGNSIGKKLTQMDNLSSQSHERILLYASLLLADELHEAQNAPVAPPAPPPMDETAALTLEAMADRLENLASKLETIS
ncbi:hypothetical protein CP97_08215 [Aurantiacibacter atlanticus]|uniref:Cell division protein ZapA n=1 Tax=Aurantiacibacter atlanticus TaxID=1648404 RepID=A0A0H4VC73_9SPHN|nr:cell division protein ZapA [Aurantiacibacter atlanticus]AKQ42010.1 hypothetical protein CP97_08215 [Aurantiacibacter atlanticus]MDF1835289.1 cell division protein ZapA [Alteraurantiacibacter sp. bin_em_oilr2.035]